jgi:hypothetical protein
VPSPPLKRIRTVKPGAVALFLLALMVAVGLRMNSVALARTIGGVPFIYLLSAIGTGLYLVRSAARRAEVHNVPKFYVGIHVLALCVFGPLLLSRPLGQTPQWAITLAPVILYLGVALARVALGDKRDWLVKLAAVFVPERMAALVAAEMRILMLGLFVWGPRSRRTSEPSFTSGSILVPVLLAVAAVGVVETVILHLVVGRWTRDGATALTAIGMLTIVYLVGLAKSFKYMPTVMLPKALVVRLGHFQSVEIPYEAIRRIKRAAPGAPAPSGSLNMAPMSAPNLLIELAEERETRGLNGRPRAFTQLALRMDDAESFEALLSDRLPAAAAAR